MSDPILYWHIHHETLCELAYYPIQDRIDYIKHNKLLNEVETRLRLLKPVKDPRKLPPLFIMDLISLRDWGSVGSWEVNQRYRKELEALHNEECPDCPWDGNTIFPNPVPKRS